MSPRQNTARMPRLTEADLDAFIADREEAFYSASYRPPAHIVPPAAPVEPLGAVWAHRIVGVIALGLLVWVGAQWMEWAA